MHDLRRVSQPASNGGYSQACDGARPWARSARLVVRIWPSGRADTCRDSFRLHRTQPWLGSSSGLGLRCDTARTSRQALLATFCAAWGSGRVFCRGRLSAMAESPFPSRELTGWPGADSSSPQRQSRWCYTRAPSQAGDFYGVQQSSDYFGGTPVASGHHHTPHSSIMTHGLGQRIYRHR